MIQHITIFYFIQTICLSLAFMVSVFLFRAGNKKNGWYTILNLDKTGIVEIPEKAIKFNKEYLTAKYIETFLKKSIYATAWFFVTFSILVMALVGGSTIVDNNPSLKVPVVALIMVMELICVLQLLFVMVIFIEDFIFKPLACVYIASVIHKEPLRIHHSKKYGNKKLMGVDKPNIESVVVIGGGKKDV